MLTNILREGINRAGPTCSLWCLATEQEAEGSNRSTGSSICT